MPNTPPRTIDVLHQGNAQAIAVAVLELDDGLALVDPGPASTLPALRAGLAVLGASLDDVRALLLTHIHLDHAGATGVLVRERPNLAVYVHELGARHLIDPSRLLASARRLYGERMDSLWGEVAPVPEANVTALAGGETVRLPGRRLEVRYTPGHAYHHVSYLDEATATAFVGDTAGLRVAGGPVVLPLAPPPDFDLELWRSSLAALRAWRPARLFVTHFGEAPGPERHLAELEDALVAWTDAVRRTLAEEGDDEARAERFVAGVEAELRRRAAPDDVVRFLREGGVHASWVGIARYLRRLEPAGAR
jgi:glyoxylase-like metal-dependent hydrolase (beta-lactamase superfamily II)